MNTSSDQLRVVLIGRTGNGKSSTGNSLLHSRTAFRSIQSGRSITKDCQAKTGQCTDSNGRAKEIVVVDTPGFFDTDPNVTNQMVEVDITSQIFEMTTPGVHAFLIVLRVGRFSPEERNTVDFIRTIFGTGAASYCIVLFTSEDQLEEGQTLDSFISTSPALQELITVCGNRKLAINNKLAGELLIRKNQQLLQMIQEMVNNNNGTYYTNAEYRRIEEQRRKEQIEREEKERKRIEEYEKSLKDKAREDERKRCEAEARRQNEVINTRTETRTIEIGRTVIPIMSTERTRKKGLGGVWSHNGSGYNHHQVQIGSNTTIFLREEQREIKRLRSGVEQFGDWRVTREWSTQA